MPVPSWAALPLAEPLVALIAAALTAAWLIQAALCVWFAQLVRRRRPVDLQHGLASTPLPQAWPAAEVVLCLRGVDPVLEQAFNALADQQYAGPWRLLVVVDSEHDPAWMVASAAIARLEARGRAGWSAARLLALVEPACTGSRKSAALHQAFGALDPATELVALVDADAVVRPQWLSCLVQACLGTGVGAAGGNRWYLPEHNSGPGLVRAIWNGGALVLMTVLQIPWGGSLVIRRGLIESSGWRDLLRHSLCEDTALFSPLRRSGWSFRFVPALLAVDRDDGIRLRPLIRWLKRQLLMARLHHPSWPLVLLHGLGTIALLLVAVVALGQLLLQGHWLGAAQLGTALLLYELGCAGLLMAIQAAVAAAIPLERLIPLWVWLRWLPLGQLVYGVAAMRAAWARRVEWSGVDYRLLRHAVEVIRD